MSKSIFILMLFFSFKIIAQSNFDYIDYYNSGLSKVKSNDYFNAIADLNKAIELNPDLAAAYLLRGIAKNSLEDYRGALIDYSKSIELNPENSIAYNLRGTLKGGFLEDLRGSISDLSKAIELNPRDDASYSARGAMKYHLKDSDGACLDWSRAGELGNSEAYSYIRKYCK